MKLKSISLSTMVLFAIIFSITFVYNTMPIDFLFLGGSIIEYISYQIVFIVSTVALLTYLFMNIILKSIKEFD